MGLAILHKGQHTPGIIVAGNCCQLAAAMLPCVYSDFAMLCVASNMLPQLDHCSIPSKMLLATVASNNVA